MKPILHKLKDSILAGMRHAAWNAYSVRVYVKVLGIGILVTGLLGIVTLYLVHRTVSAELRAELSERAETLLNFAAKETRTAFEADAVPGLRLRLKELLTDMPDAALIVVDDGEGFTVRAVDPVLEADLGRDIFPGDHTFLLFRSEPVEGTEVDVTVGVSTARIDEKLMAAIWGVTRWLLVCIALAVMLILLLTHLFMRPIRELVHAATSLREGDYTTRATVQSGDEIGNLAQVFNELADNLQIRQREVAEKEAARVSLVQRMIHNQESERKTLARNLHDEIGQTLSHLLNEMQRVCSRCSNASQLCEGLSGLIDETRRLAWDFRPSILDDYGLEIALKRYAEERCAPMNIRVDCEYADLATTNGRGSRLPGEVEVTLYRIAQEAITNTIRHAGARHISVVLLKGGGEATLIVEDDGRGFDSSELESAETPSLGLLGMRERAQLLGGMMVIDSHPGSGTTVRTTVAYEQVAP